MNSLPVYVIDTSYLLELFAVPGCSTEEAVVEIRNRAARAARKGARLYVTIPSVYELAEHISDIRDGNRSSGCTSGPRTGTSKPGNRTTNPKPTWGKRHINRLIGVGAVFAAAPLPPHWRTNFCTRPSVCTSLM